MRQRYHHVEGDYYDFIQSPEISSSTDQINYRSPIRCIPSTPNTYPRGRISYRSVTSNQIFRNIPLNPNRRIMGSVQNHGQVLPQERAYIKHKFSTRYSLLCLAILFTSSLGILITIYRSFPDLSAEERQHIKIPWNLQDAKQLGVVLDKYKEDHYYQVFFGVCMTYIFLQTFAIPGSLFLSVLSGFLFSFFQALILVCTCSALGASLCFLISQIVGKRLVRRYFPERANSWAVTVERHKDNLLNYMIFLRVTPFVPNWFINLTAPVIGVPLVPFALGTFIGVAPPSFIALQAGKTLHTMSASDSALSWSAAAMLIIFGILSLVPIYFKDRLKTKFE